MSTSINTDMTTHKVHEFWGGDHRGRCLQITASSAINPRTNLLQQEGFIQLTRDEAVALKKDLTNFIRRNP